jgi:hypothetical protein
MDALIQKLFDLQFELTIMGAELDERINRLDCLPGVHAMVQSESRNLILLAANIKFDAKVLKLAIQRMEHQSNESRSADDATAALNDIENLYYNAFKRFVILLEKLEANPRNQPVENVVRQTWARLGETYQEFRRVLTAIEANLLKQPNDLQDPIM